MKELSTLVEDVYSLFDPNHGHEPNEDNLEEVCNNLKAILRDRLAKREDIRNPLRFSSLGKPDRQLWYDAHPDGTEEELSPKTFLKFLYGDIIEQLVLFLAKEAGHTVEQTQGEIEVDGVLGHIDAIVDGVVVDVKSASPFGYKKFEQDKILQEDPFGYVQQLSGYADVLTPGQSAAWIAFDKVSADVCVAPLSVSVIEQNKAGPRIEHLKKVIASESIPDRCYQPVEDGAKGNMVLPTPCSYCKHKRRCHPSLRTFMTGSGPKFMTKVVVPPKRRDGTLCPEITDKN